MEDLIKDFISNSLRRIRSPFLFSFLVSMSLFSYKILLVFFGEGGFENKISYIQDSKNLINENALCYSIYIALFYSIIYPLLDILVVIAREWIENSKERALLWSKKKRYVDRDFQKDYFEKYENENSKLRKELQVTTTNQVESIRDLRCHQDRFQERISRWTLLCLTCVGVNNHMNDNSFCFSKDQLYNQILIDPGLVNGEAHDSYVIELFRNFPYKTEIISLLTYVLRQKPIKGDMIFDFKTVNNELGIGSQELNDICDILVVLNIFNESSSEPKVYSSKNANNIVEKFKAMLEFAW